jgi:tRNA-dihydrouridine synthase B
MNVFSFSQNQVLPELLSPFLIGGLSFPNRLIQGPLAGISCGAFRELFSLYQKPAFCVTEMISAKDLIAKKNKDSRYVRRSPYEGLLCYQLSGDNPAELSEAVSIVEGLGADLIDLNIGCPKAKIRGKGAGSKLLESPELLFNILSGMRRETSLPLTAKIRTRGQTNDSAYLEASDAIEASGVDALIVHTRHWTEDYEVECAYEQCALLVERLSIPVIANGDVRDEKSLNRCLKETGAVAVMVSRQTIGKPWWYQSILGEDPEVTHQTQVSLYIHHLHQLVSYVGSEYIALLEGRRLLKHYLGDIFDKESLRAFYAATSINGLAQLLKDKT